ncbi:hypothetical protein BGX20_009865 [Mortierella sp. AD010]|nr:hypothetical protein BGX20_009865 [Mortierella sp. AD010]
MDDLMNLSFNDAPPPSWGTVGGISLGASNNNVINAPVPPPLLTSNNSGGALPYNMFASPTTSVNPISISPYSTPATSSASTPQTPSTKKVSPMDDFEFVSNTGATSQDVGPASVSSIVLMNKDGLQIDLDIEKQSRSQSNINLATVATTPSYRIKAYFSNHQNNPITSLTFRVAVPKSLQLKLDPQSAQVVPPFSKKTVTQDMMIQATAAAPAVVRMRYHVSYTIAGRTIEAQGEFSQFP